MSKSFLIEIQERLGEGAFWVITSRHLSGLFLGGHDLDALRRDLPEAIRALFRLNYAMEVEVRPLEIIGDLDVPTLTSPRAPSFTAIPKAA